MEYKYGNKNQWRRWMWNRVAESTKNRREKKVLYLAGPDAHDVGAASLRGFDKRNMIAVEKDPNALRNIRGSGLLAIDGEICDVMEAWPQELPVGVVIADFCSGMESKIVNRIAMGSAHHWPFIDTTFCFNFLRGRDPSSKDDRSRFIGCDRIKNPLHRGEIFFNLYVASFLMNSIRADSSFDGAWDIPELQIDRAWDFVTLQAQPKFYSYRSTAGSQYFDSVVFSSVMGTNLRHVYGSDACTSPKQVVPVELIPQRRRTSAVLAHRTQRMAKQ